jgi:hypothetical protein
MITPTPDPAPTLAQVFTTLFKAGRTKLTPQQVAEELDNADVHQVLALMTTVFFADLLHMSHLKVSPDATCYTWHYGITARARRIVAAVGLDAVTDEIIKSEYNDAMAWRPRKTWTPAPQNA